MAGPYEALVTGGGLNGLTCAGYPARAAARVVGPGWNSMVIPSMVKVDSLPGALTSCSQGVSERSILILNILWATG